MRRLLPEPAADLDPGDAYADAPVAVGRAAVRVNMIASLDGAITLGGRSGGLGGPADRDLFIALRALADVVLVGAGTARAERYGPPRLSGERRAARVARGQAPLPRLAVVSRSLGLDPSLRFIAEATDETRPLIITCAASPADARERLARLADVLVAGEDEVDLGRALADLARRGAASVVCEGGPRLNDALAEAGLIDELCLTVAPLLVGEGPHMLSGPLPAQGGLPMRLHAAYEQDGFMFLRHRAGVEPPAPGQQPGGSGS